METEPIKIRINDTETHIHSHESEELNPGVTLRPEGSHVEIPTLEEESNNDSSLEVSGSKEDEDIVHQKSVIIPNSLITVEERTVLSPGIEDLSYISDYKKVQLGLDSEEKAFALTPRMFFQIEKMLPDFTNKVAQSIELGGKTRVWEASPILSILAKSLLEESTKYSTWIAQRISEKAKGKESIKICDLCSGAGITSSKIYIELKKQGLKTVQIHGVDNSVESLSVSYLLFQSQGIPCTLLKNPDLINTIPKDYDGVVLIYADAEGYMGEIGEDVKYNDVVSDNGVSYFSQPKHDKVLRDTKNHLLDNAGVYLSSLNPKYTVKLSKIFLVGEILTGGRKSQSYISRIEKGKPQYEISKDGKIRKAMTIETGRQIEFMRLLLMKDLPTFLKYMKGLSKATKAAEVLKDEILSPVNEVLDSISEVYSIPKDQITSYPQIIGSPCDVIEAKV